MHVKFILPALTEATSPFFRPIKYSLFPPLGLATLAAYLGEDDTAEIFDEHVQRLSLDDQPDVVAIEVYVTSARRAYEVADAYRARGVHVCMGGLHPTAMPHEAAQHADTVFLGPGEDTWPAFLADFRAGKTKRVYRSEHRTLLGAPLPRRDLIDRSRYLAPNSLVVSRGCPHSCDFCYKHAFFHGGRSHYVREVDVALAEVASLPGRHLFFLDDHLFGHRRFAHELFEGMRGMGRVFQAAATVESILEPGLLESAAEAGLRSLFVGFETLSAEGLASQGKTHNIGRDYDAAVRRAHDLGVMVNASFVFGMDGDGPDVFGRTVEWAVSRGVETATFHILTPYPGTPLHERMRREGRLLSTDWDLYDTRHTVFRPKGMTAEELEAGYHAAYQEFYSLGSILEAAGAHERTSDRVRHAAYSVGWKKLEPVWDIVIRAHQLGRCLPLLETVLEPISREVATPAPGPVSPRQAPRSG